MRNKLTAVASALAVFLAFCCGHLLHSHALCDAGEVATDCHAVEVPALSGSHKTLETQSNDCSFCRVQNTSAQLAEPLVHLPSPQKANQPVILARGILFTSFASSVDSRAPPVI